MVSPIVLPALYGIVALVVGIASTVLLHGPVLSVLPAGEWSPIIAWGIAAVASYSVVVPLVGYLGMIVFAVALGE